jgi:hypothetical protein
VSFGVVAGLQVAGCAGRISSDLEIKPSDLELIQVTGKAFSFKTINRLALKAPN